MLYWAEPLRPLRSTIRQHLRLFESTPGRPRVFYLNVALGIPKWISRVHFDVIALHTTLLCARWFPQAVDVRGTLDWIAKIPVPKVALPQDEYDHSAVLDDWLTDLGVTVIGTNFSEAHRSILYPRAAARARFVHVLTGYIDAGVANRVVPKLRPAAERPFDVVYRASRLPFWFGHHGQLKHRIGTAAAGGRRHARIDGRCVG